MLFANFSKEQDVFQAKYKNVATLYKGKGLKFMFGDVDSTQNAFQVVMFSTYCNSFFPYSFECIRFHTIVSICITVLWT